MIMTAAVMVALALAAPVAQPEQAQQEAFTPEERRQALEALKTIARAFEPVEAARPQAEQKQQGKSMADVADKALDISTKYIGQASAIIEKAAPRVWAVMVRQQYAKAFGDLVGPLTLLLVFVATAGALRKFWKEPNNEKVYHDDDEHTARYIITLILPTVACVIVAAVFAWRLADSIMYLVNPEYYAIRDLVQLLLHPGAM